MTPPHRPARRPGDPSPEKASLPPPTTQDRAPSQQAGLVLPQPAPTTTPPLGQPRGPSPGLIGSRGPTPPARTRLLLRFRLPPRFTRTRSSERVPPPPSRRPSQQSPRRLKGEASTSAASEGAKHALLFPQAALKERAGGARSRLGRGDWGGAIRCGGRGHLGGGHRGAGHGLPRGTGSQRPPPMPLRPRIPRLYTAPRPQRCAEAREILILNAPSATAREDSGRNRSAGRPGLLRVQSETFDIY